MMNGTSNRPRDTVTVVALLTFATQPPIGLSVDDLHETCDLALYALDELELPRNDMRLVGNYVRVVHLRLPVDSHEADLACRNSQRYNNDLTEWARQQIDDYDAGTMLPSRIELFDRCMPGWKDAEARRACGR